jgi:very-short-patch-repair endonuclease
MGRIPPGLLERARELRRNATDAEHPLWMLVRDSQLGGAKSRRQRVLGPYVLDFFCAEVRLAVELDGGQHAELEYVARDAARDRYLQRCGVRVVRFWDRDVLRETEAVLETLWNAVFGDEGLPSP